MAREYPQLENPDELGYFVIYTGADANLGAFGAKSSGDKLFIPLRSWEETNKDYLTVEGFGPAGYEDENGTLPAPPSSVTFVS